LIRIGIDLGGTKIEGIALDDNGRELLRRRVPTPVGDYQETLAAVAGLVQDIENRTGQRGSVGVGAPGAISRATGRIKNSNSQCLIDKPLREDLAALLGRELRVANDANCFALSEAVDGAAAGAEVVFGVIIGTGTGGGVVVRGRVLEGVNGITGEWGHNPLPWPRDAECPGPQCYCGKHGCVETFLSGPGMTRDHANTSGQTLSAMEIVQAAERGDPACIAALERYEDRLARGLAGVINVIDPDVIVLGGGLSNIARLYSSVPRLWGSYVFSDRVDTRLVPAQYGDASGVRGAAWLWD
jgi:predicted NBD/HSP70 family sugar kinase